MNYKAEETLSLFTEAGAESLVNTGELINKLSNIKAFVFDWDGVFNNSHKSNDGSNFNEADSMGTNLLRYSYFSLKGELPKMAIISGEKNELSFYFAKRERFDNCYFKIGNKKLAIEDFCLKHNLQMNEIAYFFDDVLDLCIAESCGLRIMINRKAGVLFKKHVRENKYADFITANEGGNYAIRECCEMIMGINGNFDNIIKNRKDYSEHYLDYLQKRNYTPTQFKTLIDGGLVEIKDL